MRNFLPIILRRLRKTLRAGLRALAFVSVCATPAVSDTDQATVFAAASLRGVLEAAAAQSGVDLRVSYAGSSAMARQVALGAPADLAILAHPRWMDWLARNGPDVLDRTDSLTSNTLVLIAPKGTPALTEVTPATLRARLGTARLAMGHRAAVPAGQYAQEWLTQAGLWAAIAPQVAEVENVRAALRLVATGEAPLGVVYASDAQAEPAVQVLAHAPRASHSAIAYPAAAFTPAGARLLAHLRSPEAQAIFAQYGFQAP